MNSNRVIIISLSVPFFALFVLWLAYRFYSPDKAGPYPISNQQHRAYTDDGLALPIRISSPENAANAKGVLFMHSDRGLDRDWNSRSGDFRTGARLNKFLASRGMRVVSYNQRDLGAGSGPSFANIDDLAADLRQVVKFYFKRIAGGGKKSPRRYSIFAHGQGCLVALRAVNREKLKPARVYLVNCVYTGSLLESWGDRILNNMRRAGASPANLTRARSEFETWSKKMQRGTADGKTGGKEKTKAQKEKEKREHADILGFRRALEFLEGPKMREWSRQAASLYFARELNGVLGRGIVVTHWISRHDTEFPRERVAELEQTAGTIAARNKAYRFAVLPHSNHFLKVQAGPSRGALSTTWNRANPFARLAPMVLEELTKVKAK